VPAITVCSTAFVGLGRAQAKALGHPELPIAVIPHPFGIRTREGVRELARDCVQDIVRLAGQATRRPAARSNAPAASQRAARIEAPGDLEDLNRFIFERKWGDGLPVIPPTQERVARMLAGTPRSPDDVIATVAPGNGIATVERIAINAVMGGARPEYLPVLVAATRAVSTPAFNLSGVQATTNPAAVWLVINGPIAAKLGVNGANNCLGPGSWANATLGRSLRLILQNIGGALPGDMDRATQGQPGKYTFCCAENEEASPWEPLHVERGLDAAASSVTVIGALGTWNMNTHAKDGADLLKVIADTMMFPCGSDYTHGGEPWLILCPEHAHLLAREGMSKLDVKRRLWELSKMSASRLSVKDLGRVQAARGEELGDIGLDTPLPISVKAEDIGIIVAGGTGTHSVYIPVSGHSRSVTCAIEDGSILP